MRAPATVGDAAWLRNIRARYSDVTARSPHVYRDVVRLLGLLDDAHATGLRAGLRQAAREAREYATWCEKNNEFAAACRLNFHADALIKLADDAAPTEVARG